MDTPHEAPLVVVGESALQGLSDWTFLDRSLAELDALCGIRRDLRTSRGVMDELSAMISDDQASRHVEGVYALAMSRRVQGCTSLAEANAAATEAEFRMAPYQDDDQHEGEDEPTGTDDASAAIASWTARAGAIAVECVSRAPSHRFGWETGVQSHPLSAPPAAASAAASPAAWESRPDCHGCEAGSALETAALVDLPTAELLREACLAALPELRELVLSAEADALPPTSADAAPQLTQFGLECGSFTAVSTHAFGDTTPSGPTAPRLSAAAAKTIPRDALLTFDVIATPPVSGRGPPAARRLGSIEAATTCSVAELARAAVEASGLSALPTSASGLLVGLLVEGCAFDAAWQPPQPAASPSTTETAAAVGGDAASVVAMARRRPFGRWLGTWTRALQRLSQPSGAGLIQPKNAERTLLSQTPMRLGGSIIVVVALPPSSSPQSSASSSLPQSSSQPSVAVAASTRASLGKEAAGAGNCWFKLKCVSLRESSLHDCLRPRMTVVRFLR